MMQGSKTLLSRRGIMKASALISAAAIIGTRAAMAEPAEVEAELKRLFGSKPLNSGNIKLEVPSIAENGSLVPVNIDVESPMTADNYVRAVHLFADGNPYPTVYSYRLTPESGKASLSNRIRLAQTQNIIAVVEMSDGALYTAKSAVKVTIGGCGG
jgi:sulfur-oxidizing protein SoxY